MSLVPRAKRYKKRLRVHYGTQSPNHPGSTNNVSIGGLSIHGAAVVPRGSILFLRIELPDGRGFELSGEVRWAKRIQAGVSQQMQARMGVRFTNGAPHEYIEWLKAVGGDDALVLPRDDSGVTLPTASLPGPARPTPPVILPRTSGFVPPATRAGMVPATAAPVRTSAPDTVRPLDAASDPLRHSGGTDTLRPSGPLPSERAEADSVAQPPSSELPTQRPAGPVPSERPFVAPRAARAGRTATTGPGVQVGLTGRRSHVLTAEEQVVAAEGALSMQAALAIFERTARSIVETNMAPGSTLFLHRLSLAVAGAIPVAVGSALMCEVTVTDVAPDGRGVQVSAVLKDDEVQVAVAKLVFSPHGPL